MGIILKFCLKIKSVKGLCMNLIIKKKYLSIKAQENLQKLRRENVNITALISMILEIIIIDNIYPENDDTLSGLMPFF